jgi:hypothetical protein
MTRQMPDTREAYRIVERSETGDLRRGVVSASAGAARPSRGGLMPDRDGTRPAGERGPSNRAGAAHRFSGSADDWGGFWIGSRGGFVSGLDRTPPPGLRLLEPVALAVQLQNMEMVGEAIEQRASQALIPEEPLAIDEFEFGEAQKEADVIGPPSL